MISNRELEAIELRTAATASTYVPALVDEICRLRDLLNAIGDLAYRIDPGSPFVADGLRRIHALAKTAAEGGTR